MGFRGIVEEAGPFQLRGWATSDTFPSLTPFVDIVVNRRMAAKVRAGVFREDLLAQQFGDGRRGFCFNPFESLLPGLNVVELFVSGSDQLLENGTHHLSGDIAKPPSLTGTNGDAEFLLNELDRLVPIGQKLNCLVLGRGLSKAAQQRGWAVTEAEPDSIPDGTPQFDLTLAAGASEFWFPSIAATLNRIYRALKPGGRIIFDLPCEDDELAISRAVFDQSRGGAFRRIYSESELRSFLLESGFEILEIVIGMNTAEKEKRVLVTGKKPEVII